MVRSPSAAAKSAVKSNGSIRGQPVRNAILLALPSHACAALFSKMEFVLLPVRTVLNEADEAIKFAYFLNDGLASFLSIAPDGKSVEVGLCGREGFVGLPLTAGLSTSPTRVIIQVAGQGFRIGAKQLLAAMQDCPELARRLQRFVQEMALQSSQVAACNRLHEVDERLARWLLMSQDRLSGDLVPLTQEFLAHMLGTRRASVSVAAGILQKAGLITYKRGTVKIENRARLEEAACNCYDILVRQVQNWHAESR
jgi:CRP-like cAMP-binding protein